MTILTDPRRYGAADSTRPLLRLAERDADRTALAHALHELAAADRDGEIAALLRAAPSQPVYARIWRALCAALEHPAPEEGVAVRVFALPWVIVCASSAAATLPCVLRDVGALTRVLDEGGVFGDSRNLGLTNALVSIETLERLRPGEVLRMSSSPELRDLAPEPIQVARGGVEEVHVRFLLGAAVAPAHAPGVVETGANIGTWGTPALRAMAGELAVPGVQVLPMPRPPAGLVSAAWSGRHAGIEAAFNLFMSNAVRRFRSSVGDPEVTLSAHAGGEIRVTLRTPFDDALVEGFRWPLHPADDLGEIECAITSLLSACRLGDPRVAQGVLPDHSTTGAVLFPRT